ncbi:hypothetical protein B0A54_06840 [Friedmanniomyces endolithicus]|uniref:MARVEL domain-containing protein n=1 Tax=Friedmanniomyces endolithicus TaxID=329885 RepID=A0A4U0V1C2_9PEZI|nr:hypothetical protein B0A54_06840 [Friedmanniomyces endolithicus]
MIGNLIARAFQILCGAVVLGLSISAIKWQYFGSAPATTSYSAFAGAFGVLAALIGIATSFVEAIPEIIMVGVDGLAAVLLLAGGLVHAFQYSWTAEADSAFLFLGFLASLAAAVLCFLASRRGGRGVKSSAV